MLPGPATVVVAVRLVAVALGDHRRQPGVDQPRKAPLGPACLQRAALGGFGLTKRMNPGAAQRQPGHALRRQARGTPCDLVLLSAATFKAARAISTTVPVVVRTRYRLEADRLQAAGATVAVAEELEASLEVVAQLLGRLDIAGNLIEPLLDVFRRELVSLRPLHAPRDMHDSLTEAIRRTPVSTHRVEREHWGKGRSISEINLRAATNASVIAIQRADRYITALSPEERLQAGDVLFLVGDDTDVMLARNLLVTGK